MPCLRCGVVSAGTYCADHTPKRVETRRGRTYTKRHHRNPAAWKRFSRWARATSGACEVCGTRERLHVHHDNPDLDTYDRAGLRVLCAKHHAERDAEQRRGREGEPQGVPAARGTGSGVRP